jgi:hypothetical protein
VLKSRLKELSLGKLSKLFITWSDGGICCTDCDVGFDVGGGFVFAAPGPLPPEPLNDAGCTGVIGVEGVGVAGGSSAFAFVVEFFLFGR